MQRRSGCIAARRHRAKVDDDLLETARTFFDTHWRDGLSFDGFADLADGFGSTFEGLPELHDCCGVSVSRAFGKLQFPAKLRLELNLGEIFVSVADGLALRSAAWISALSLRPLERCESGDLLLCMRLILPSHAVHHAVLSVVRCSDFLTPDPASFYLTPRSPPA